MRETHRLFVQCGDWGPVHEGLVRDSPKGGDHPFAPQNEHRVLNVLWSPWTLVTPGPRALIAVLGWGLILVRREHTFTDFIHS